MKTLVIGYGNVLRGDNGVGYRVAEAVEAWSLPDVVAKPCHQLTPELSADMAEVDQVVFVDVTPPQNPCSALTLEQLTAERDHKTVSTHHNTPEYLLGMSQILYGHSPKAYAIWLPSRNFELSEQLSPIAESGMKQALAQIRHLIESGKFQ